MHSTSDVAARLADSVRQAMQAHGAGRIDEARIGYEAVLAREPAHPDALHLLGVLTAHTGQLDEAAALLRQAIAANPAEAMFHNNAGNIAVERNRLDEAEACYLRAIELDPARLDALNNLGVLLGRRGDAAGAEKVLLRVLELAPEFGDARQNLAHLLMRQARPSDAAQHCIDGLLVAPRSPALRRLLGVAYSSMGMRAEAIAVYRAWLEADPGNAVARHHLSACTGEAVPDRAADAYVTGVFDRFASSFDAKLAELGYQAPALVADAVARHAGVPSKALDVLDAGCGTGLCAPQLAPFARRLAGVDLSEGMLRRAIERRLYDELVSGELVACFRLRPQAWDLIVSADTLCYFGRLEDFAAAAAGALRAGGLLVFTVESLDAAEGTAPFRLEPHGRYSHRRAYVEAVLAEAGLAVIDVQAAVLRQEAGRPVDGWLVCARQTAAH